jgi:hypothetical protein
MRMRKVFVSISFIVCTFALVSFFSIDACIDAGGRWDNMGFNCLDVGKNFVPQYQRIAPFFWLLVVSLAGVAALIIHKVLPTSAKP